jgi:hypothetical protein
MLALGPITAQADTTHGTIPFPFRINNKTLPAGEYEVRPVFGSQVVYLTNVHSGRTFMVVRPAGQSSGPANLVFKADRNDQAGQTVK